MLVRNKRDLTQYGAKTGGILALPIAVQSVKHIASAFSLGVEMLEYETSMKFAEKAGAARERGCLRSTCWSYGVFCAGVSAGVFLCGLWSEWDLGSQLRTQHNHSLNFQEYFLWNNLLIFSREAVLGIICSLQEESLTELRLLILFSTFPSIVFKYGEDC